MTDTTKLNRRVAELKGLVTMQSATGLLAWRDVLAQRTWENGSAWADSADVALVELWADLRSIDTFFQSDVEAAGRAEVYEVITERKYSGYDGPVIEGETLAIAITRAWISCKEATMEK